MAIKHTGNTAFFSKSNKIGSTRWALGSSPVLQRGYVLDLAFMNLPSRWYVIGLVNRNGVLTIRAYENGTEAEASLDDADIQALLAADPAISVVLNTNDAAVVIERFERAVSNVMHGLLAPLPEVEFIWKRFASTDGVGAYARA